MDLIFVNNNNKKIFINIFDVLLIPSSHTGCVRYYFHFGETKNHASEMEERKKKYMKLSENVLTLLTSSEIENHQRMCDYMSEYVHIIENDMSIFVK